jgi:carbon-monoxide dehydrogenase small subunit
MSDHILHFTLNGQPTELNVSSDRMLIDVLRDDLGLTGTKEGCSIGVCGLCTVLRDGEPISSCLVHAVQIDGSTLQTVEGLADDGELSELQDSFIRHGGFQCGICTSGQLMAATALLSRNSQPDRDEIKEWMMGNLCRCTGYEGIINAITAVASSRSEES